MNCEQFGEHMADHLAGSLPPAASAEFQAHMAACAACRGEAENLRGLWAGLGLIREASPSRALRGRFYQSLEAYRHGLNAAPAPAPRAWWRPQFALAAAMLVVGVAAGYLLGSGRGAQVEVAQLQGELRNMRQMVTLALLERQSASDRLRGVDLGGRFENPDQQVLSALLHTVNHDASVNVRLAAVDALRRFASGGMVRTALDDSLLKQDSPMVQLALIDLMVAVRNREAAPAVRALSVNTGVNPAVKERAELALRQLE